MIFIANIKWFFLDCKGLEKIHAGEECILEIYTPQNILLYDMGIFIHAYAMNFGDNNIIQDTENIPKNQVHGLLIQMFLHK